MKYEDLKKATERVDELALNQLIGDFGAAAAKQIGNRILGRGEGSLSVQDKIAKDKFLQDFVGRASSALNSAVSSGLVDPNLDGSGQKVQPQAAPAANAQPGAASPATPAAPTATPAAKSSVSPGVKGAAQIRGQRQTNQNLNNYVQNAAKALNAAKDRNQKIQLTKELVNFMADRKNYPEWDNAVATVQQVIKRGNVDPNFANAAVAKLKAGQTIAEAWQIHCINQLLEAVDLTWEDLDLTVLKESKGSSFKIVESKYYKLNNIFESIVSEAQAESIQSWFKRWFTQYMQGVDLSSPQTAEQVNQYIDAIQKSYTQDNGKAAIKQLANAAYALSMSNQQDAKTKAASTAGDDSETDTTDTTAPATQPKTVSSGENVNQLAVVAKNALQKLQKIDPASYSAFIKQLMGSKAPAATPSNKSTFTPPSAPAKTPVAKAPVTAESKKIKPFKNW